MEGLLPMNKISPLVLLDPAINISLKDILNKFKDTPLIGVTNAHHSANYLYFTAVVCKHENVYQVLQCRANAVIKYDSSIGEISLIYLTNVRGKIIREYFIE